MPDIITRRHLFTLVGALVSCGCASRSTEPTQPAAPQRAAVTLAISGMT